MAIVLGEYRTSIIFVLYENYIRVSMRFIHRAKYENYIFFFIYIVLLVVQYENYILC